MATMFVLLGVLLVLIVPVGSFCFWLWRRSKREPVLLYQPLDIGRVLGRTFSVFGKPRLLVLALLFIGLPRLIGDVGTRWFGLAKAAGSYQASGNPNALNPATIAISTGLGLLFILIGFLFTVPATLSLVGDFEGIPVDLSTGLRRTPALVLPMIGLFILVMLGIVLGMIVFVWPGIILLLSWSIAYPVMIVEGQGVIASLKRSHALTIGSRGRILLILILFYVVLLLLFVPMTFLMARLGALTPSLLIGSQVVYALLGGVIGASLPAALYAELREIKQGSAPDGLAEVFA